MVDRRAAQPRVRVDETLRPQRNEEVMLCRSGRSEDQVAARDGAAGGREAGAGREGEVAGHVAVAQGIAGRGVRPAERAGDEADAIEAGRRITPAEAEGRTRKGFRLGGETIGSHRGIG